MHSENLSYILSLISGNTINTVVNQLQNVNAQLENEFMLTVQEQQVNDALANYVTKNVDSILDMKISLHHGWFRLACRVNIQGIFVSVASNFDLVHIQLDRQRQRLVFAQRGNTEILELYAKNYLYKVAIDKGVPLFRKLTKQDPLGLILKKIKLANVKENVIYIDIGRWMRQNKKIMTTLYKAQVNYGECEEQQLILKAKLNPRDLLAANASGDIITENDNPDLVIEQQDANTNTTTDTNTDNLKEEA